MSDACRFSQIERLRADSPHVIQVSTRPELDPWLASVFVSPDQQALYHRLGWRAFEEGTYLGEQVTLMAKCLSETTR